MNTTRLRYFLTVAETGHVGRAAEVLHVSQPALSRALQAFEHELGLGLIERQGRGIVITPAGRELARRARPLLAEFDEIRYEVAALGETLSPLRFASHETFGTAFAARLSARAGGMAFEHRYLGPEQITDSLRAGDIDVGLSYVPVLADGIDVEEACRIRISTWGQNEFAAAAFDELPFAAPARGIIVASPRPQGLDAWPDERFARRIRYRVSHTQTALELCREGLAVAFLADFLVELFDRYTPANNRLRRIAMPADIEGHLQPVYVLLRTGERPDALVHVTNELDAISAS